MHGLIFTSFRQYSWTRLEEHAPAIWADRSAYSAERAYPDEEFTALLDKSVEVTKRTPREILLDFGRFTGFWVFRVLRPEYYEGCENTRTFLLEVESRIHETIRADTTGALPPRLTVAELGTDGVAISYTSDRRLCDLLEGLVNGVAEYYGERFEVTQPMCMHRGDAGCSFFVTPA